MQNLRKNLEVLARKSRDLAARVEQASTSSRVRAEASSSGAFTIRVDGRLEASHLDPERDGRDMAAHFLDQARRAGASRLVVFGLGVYTLRELAAFDGAVLVIEPSLEVLRSVLEHVDLSEVLERVDLVAGGDARCVLRHPTFAPNDRESRGLFVAHPTTRRREASLYEQLAARFDPGGDAHPLDIAVIPPLYGGSLPVATAAARALRKLGHRVRDIDLAPFWPGYQALSSTQDPRLGSRPDELRHGLTRLIGEWLLTQFLLDPPDVVFALAQAPIDVETLARLRSRGVVCAFWFCEDAHVMPYWEDVCTSYDVFFHVQPDVLAEPLRERGVFGAPLEMAADPEVHFPVSLAEDERARYGCDLSFVGAGYHNRREFLPGLIDLGLRIYGTDWPLCAPFAKAMPEPNVRQSSAASNLIFNASNICLNLHSSPWTDGVNPLGDYLNPRCFELAAAKRFQLVDERRALASAFVIGREVETYATLEECRKKVHYYLARESERDDIAASGHARVLRGHTYVHRMKTAVDVLRSGPEPVLPRRNAKATVGAVARTAESQEPELTRILERLDQDLTFDPDAISLAVLLGKGDLSFDEKLLLFVREAMNEIQVLNEAGDPA